MGHSVRQLLVKGAIAVALGVLVSTPMVATCSEFSDAGKTQILFGITGSAHGRLNPTNLLIRPQVARVVAQLTNGPLALVDADRLLSPAGLSSEDLIRTGIARRAGQSSLAIDLVWMSARDRQQVQEVAREFGRLLATHIWANRSKLEEKMTALYRPGVPDDLMRFVIVGCMILDWQALRSMSRTGLRAKTRDHGEFGQYELWAHEEKNLDQNRAIYDESHTGDFGSLRFTTFGDKKAVRQGLPDFLWRIGNAVDSRELRPEVRRLLIEEVETALQSSAQVLARLLVELREGPRSISDLKSRFLTPADFDKGMRLGLALEYLSHQGEHLWATIPVFTREADESKLAVALAHGEKLVNQWLDDHYEMIRRRLNGLSAHNLGIAYERLFTTIWHDIFGWAIYHLTSKQWVVNPYGPNHRFQGYVAFAWQPGIDLSKID